MATAHLSLHREAAKIARQGGRDLDLNRCRPCGHVPPHDSPGPVSSAVRQGCSQRPQSPESQGWGPGRQVGTWHKAGTRAEALPAGTGQRELHLGGGAPGGRRCHPRRCASCHPQAAHHKGTPGCFSLCYPAPHQAFHTLQSSVLAGVPAAVALLSRPRLLGPLGSEGHVPAGWGLE